MKLAQALEQTERETPYSTSTIHRLAGQPVRQEFGGSCVFMNHILAQKLQEAGHYQPTYLESINRAGHCLAVVQEGEERYVLDPFLLQAEPISLSEIRKSPTILTYPAYPVIEGEYSKIEVVPYNENHFSMSWVVMLDGEPQILTTFEYNLNNPQMSLPSLDKLGDLQNSVRQDAIKAIKNLPLNIRLLNDDNSVTSLSAGKKDTRAPRLRTLGQSHISQRRNPEAYQLEITRIATHLKVEVHEILDFFSTAKEICQKNDW